MKVVVIAPWFWRFGRRRGPTLSLHTSSSSLTLAAVKSFSIATVNLHLAMTVKFLALAGTRHLLSFGSVDEIGPKESWSFAIFSKLLASAIDPHHDVVSVVAPGQCGRFFRNRLN